MRKPFSLNAEVLTAAQVKLPQEKYAGLPPLLLHVLAFGALQDKDQIIFSVQTIKDKLAAAGETSPGVVGALVDAFNAQHEGKCPFISNVFAQVGQTNFGSALHLGTGRLYNQDGSFNEANWQKLVTALPADLVAEKRIKRADLYAYLDSIKDWPEEAGTNRHDNPLSLFDNKAMQINAAKAAWMEVFKLFASDWYLGGDGVTYEPIVDLDLLKLFFTNTPLALVVAKQNGLPVQSPEVSLVEKVEKAIEAAEIPVEKAEDKIISLIEKAITTTVDALVGGLIEVIEEVMVLEINGLSLPAPRSPLLANSMLAAPKKAEPVANTSSQSWSCALM